MMPIKFKNNNNKIDFLIGGTQKGGTSALDFYLRQHPDIGLGEVKELHFFDDENAFLKTNVNYSKYEKRFNFSENKLIYGETTPIYLYWIPCPERIWNYNKDIKLIFILRNPINRAFSHWNMEYDRDAEKKDFSFAIRNEEFRSREELPMQHRVYSYKDRGYYSEQIRRYKRYFTDDQMLFIKYEDFNQDQEGVLNTIFEFLGLDSNTYNFERQIINVHKKNAILQREDKIYLLNEFEFEIKQVEKMLNWDCSDWLN